MRIRFVAPLALMTFGLLLSAVAQEDPRPARAPGKLVTRTYPVADLVIPLDCATFPPRHAFHAMPYAACTAEPCCAQDARAVPPPPAPCPAAPQPVSTASAKKPSCEAGPCAAPKATTETQLIHLITNTVCPQSWSEMGGPGTIDYFPLGMALVINATPDVHEQIAELLQSLRRLQDVSVSLEVRVVAVAEGFAERVGLDLRPDGCERIGVDFNACPVGRTVKELAGPAGTPRVAFLNDAQVTKLLEAFQGDQSFHVCQAPKLMVVNGQTANVKIASNQWFVTGVTKVQAGDRVVDCPRQECITTGLDLCVQPAVSADRRHVQLKVKSALTSVDTPVPMHPVTTLITPIFEGGAEGKPVPFTQYIQQPSVRTLALDKILAIPDGGTVVLGGWKRPREVAQAEGVPAMKKVPFLSRLFKAAEGCDAAKPAPACREMETVFLMVTPRVVVCEEKEYKVTAGRGVRVAVPAPMSAPAMMPVPCVPPAPPMIAVAPRPAPAVVSAPCLPPPRTVMAPAVKPAEYVIAVEDPTCKPDYAGSAFRAKQVAKIVEMYHEACAGGHTAEARKLAAFALELDPTCFSKHGGPAPARKK